jgi:hypothetical protein
MKGADIVWVTKKVRIVTGEAQAFELSPLGCCLSQKTGQIPFPLKFPK